MATKYKNKTEAEKANDGSYQALYLGSYLVGVNNVKEIGWYLRKVVEGIVVFN